MKLSPLILASALVAGTAGTAAAQSGRLADCRDDIQKYCASSTRETRGACLQGNMSVLTNACKAAVATMQPNAAGISSPTSDGTKTIPNSAGTYR